MNFEKETKKATSKKEIINERKGKDEGKEILELTKSNLLHEYYMEYQLYKKNVASLEKKISEYNEFEAKNATPPQELKSDLILLLNQLEGSKIYQKKILDKVNFLDERLKMIEKIRERTELSQEKVNKEEILKENATQEEIVLRYLDEYKRNRELMEQCQALASHLHGLRLFPDVFSERIKEREKELKALSLMIDESQKVINDLFDKLSPESREKYLKNPSIEEVMNNLFNQLPPQLKEKYSKGLYIDQQQEENKKTTLYKEATNEELGKSKKPEPVVETESKDAVMRNFMELQLQVLNIDKDDYWKEYQYFKDNLRKIADQKLSSYEAKRIINVANSFIDQGEKLYPEEKLQDKELQDLVETIKKKTGLLEEYRLYGNKVQFKYQGKPIDIYAGGKHFQIVDARKNWNVPYLLIDLENFDYKIKKGYKGIRDGEKVSVGRENPLRFDFPPTFSYKHFNVSFEQGIFTVEDLKSADGTVVKLEKLEPDLLKFYEYVFNNVRHIENLLQDIQNGRSYYRSLAEFFYDEFYNGNVNFKLKFDPQLFAEYDKKVEALYNRFFEAYKNDKSLGVVYNGYWVTCGVNGGLSNWTEAGRFYFNVKSEYATQVTQFFEELAQICKDRGLHVEIKIPAHGNEYDFNRFDKMVAYFDSKEEKEMLEVIETLYAKYANLFNEEVPSFTLKVRDKSGREMNGIGFGEEPAFANGSFGSIRSEILEDMYYEWRQSDFAENFDWESAFRRACVKYKVDPVVPCFNLATAVDKNKFSEIKRRFDL